MKIVFLFLLSFFIVITQFSTTLKAEDQKVYFIGGANYIVNKDMSQADLVLLIKKRGLSREGLLELLNIRKITIPEIKKAIKGTREDKTLLIKKILGNGLVSYDLERLLDKEGVTQKGKTFLQTSDKRPVLFKSSKYNEYPGVEWKPSENLDAINSYPGVEWKPKEDLNKYPGVEWSPSENSDLFKYPGVEWGIKDESKLKTHFLTKVKTGVFKVNFTDIVSSNAGEIQASFVGKDNFPTQILLPEGFKLDLKPSDVQKGLDKKVSLENKFKTLKARGTKVGNIIVKPLELQILPDRIRYIQKTQIEFTTAEELNNLKSNFSEIFSEDLPNLETDSTFNSRSSKSQLEAKSKLTNIEIASSFKSALDKLTEEDLYKTLAADCESDGFENCSIEDAKAIFNNSIKTLTTTDALEISLLPPTIEDIKNGKSRIITKPGLVRVSKSNILGDYENLRMVTEIRQVNLINQNSESLEEINPLIEENYCENKYTGNSAKISECNIELRDYKNRTTATYTKELLNGFTLGEEKNNHWGIDLTIKIKNPVTGNVVAQRRIFELSLDSYYAYGFGLRIPIVVSGEVSDSKVDNFTNTSSMYGTKIKVDTLDADSDYYSRVGLADNKVFGGKEFVLELTAGTRVYVFLRNAVEKEFNFPLISMLMTSFGDELFDSLGITDAQVRMLNIHGVDSVAKLKAYVIQYNGFDFGRNFKPPFSHDERIQLTDLSTPYFPVYVDGVFFLYGKLGLRSFLRGKITVKCENVNSSGGCVPERDGNRIDLETKNWYTGRGYASYNNENKSDILGKYSSFGPKYSDFKYHPVLDTEVWAQAKGVAKIPGVTKFPFETPQIVVYSFTMESDDIALGKHKGTDGTFDMTTKNKVYNVKSELIDIEEIVGLEVKGEMLGESLFEVLPQENYMGNNKTYYTLDGTNPSCTGRGTEYTRPINIWPEYKTELTNGLTANKIITVTAISCDTYTNAQTNIKSQDFLLKNYYHKPVYKVYSTNTILGKSTYSNPIITKQYNYYNSSDDINSDSKGEYIKLSTTSISPLNNESFIKYKYYYPGEVGNPSDTLGCTSIYDEKYDGERITFKSFNSTKLKTVKEKVLDTSRVGYGQSVNIYAIQCIKRDNGTYYKSHISTFQITNKTVSSAGSK